MWEQRYATSDSYVYGKEPTTFLRDHTASLKGAKTALSVADGEGRNSVFLAEQGLRVTALEFAPSAIARAHALADERGVSVDFREANVLTRDWEEDAFDITFASFIQFTDPAGRKTIFEGMKQVTKPGGLVMLHGYTPKQLEFGTGGPRKLENLYTKEMLHTAFEGWDILENRAYEREIDEGIGHVGLSALIDFIARKP